MSSTKIIFGNEIRRINIEDKVTYNGLTEKITKMFQLENFANHLLKYRDDEGEVVTITSDEELQEAIRIFKEDVFRVYVVKKPQPQPQRPACGTRSCHQPGAQRSPNNFFQFLQNLQKLREENYNDEEDSDDEEDEQSPQGKAIHFNVICDGCDARPLVGTRYKSTVTDNFDLCETCFNKSSADEKKNYSAIENPASAFPFPFPFFNIRQQASPAPAPVAPTTNVAPVPAPEKKEEVVVEKKEEKKESSPVVVAAPSVVATLVDEPKEVKKPVVAEPIPAPSAPALYPDVIQEKQPAPSPAPAQPNKFEQALETLQNMGFVNRQNNIAALVRARGSLVEAIQALLNA